MARQYNLKARADKQDETRQRIVEAAIELHQTIGPRATGVSEIARRAEVGRVTVYRHFPDELSLARACSGQYFERNPAPDPDRWLAIRDPHERLRTALSDVYAYHRTTKAMMSHVLSDARDHEVVGPYHAHWRRATDVLMRAWPERGKSRKMLRAAIGLALSFDTWRSLTGDGGLTDEQAVAVALRLTCLRSMR